MLLALLEVWSYRLVLFSLMSDACDGQNYRSSLSKVTNLDTGIEQREVKQLVTSLFNECVSVISVQVYRMEGGSLGVIVKVSLF